MISYKLALKLKEAGFPQHHAGGNGMWDTKDNTYAPTLSELIDAVVEKGKRDIKITISGQTSWWSMAQTLSNKNIIPVQTGKTPEEVVAKLWLELNKTIRIK